jgi:hypothetical protein
MRERRTAACDPRRHGAQSAAAALQRRIGNRALSSLRLLQRAQIGRITTPAKRRPHFTYEPDAAIDYAKLASHYGVSVGQISAENPGVDASKLRQGQTIRVSALNPPAADSQPAEAGAARVVKGVAGTTVPVLWSPGGNKVGDIEAGRSLFVLPGGVDVPFASIKNPAAGIVKEMEQRNLVAGGMMLFGHIDAASMEEPAGAAPPRPAWSRKLKEGPRLMDGSKASYQVIFDHVLPAVPEGVTQFWQVVEVKKVVLNAECKLETETDHAIDIVDIGGHTAISDSWGLILRDDPCFVMEASRATVGFDDRKSGFDQQTNVSASAALAARTLRQMTEPKGTYSGVYTFVKAANCPACADKLKALQEEHKAPDGEALEVDGVGKWP